MNWIHVITESDKSEIHRKTQKYFCDDNMQLISHISSPLTVAFVFLNVPTNHKFRFFSDRLKFNYFK